MKDKVQGEDPLPQSEYIEIIHWTKGACAVEATGATLPRLGGGPDSVRLELHRTWRRHDQSHA